MASKTSATVCWDTDNELILELHNDYGSSQKRYASIDQLLGDLRRWFVVGLDWEPKLKIRPAKFVKSIPEIPPPISNPATIIKINKNEYRKIIPDTRRK